MNEKLMSLVEIGKEAEERARNILIKENFDVIEDSSKNNWCSPYDFIAKKENLNYIIEVRSRTKNFKNFYLKESKIMKLKSFENSFIVLLNSNEYSFIDVKQIDLNKVNLVNKFKIYIIKSKIKKYEKQNNPLYCDYCQRIIKGHSESHSKYLLLQHKLSKHRNKLKIEENGNSIL